MDVLNNTGVPNGFGLQLCNGLSGSASASKQGNLWIGGWDSTFTSGAMQWISVTGDDWYEVMVSCPLLFFFFFFFLRSPLIASLN